MKKILIVLAAIGAFSGLVQAEEKIQVLST